MHVTIQHMVHRLYMVYRLWLLSSNLWAVVMMASTTSMILWRAESVPIVMSVPQKSLSIDPTMPTMCKAEYLCTASSSIRPDGEISQYDQAAQKCSALSLWIQCLTNRKLISWSEFSSTSAQFILSDLLCQRAKCRCHERI